MCFLLNNMKYKKSHPSCKLSCYYNAELFTILFTCLMTASLFQLYVNYGRLLNLYDVHIQSLYPNVCAHIANILHILSGWVETSLVFWGGWCSVLLVICHCFSRFGVCFLSRFLLWSFSRWLCYVYSSKLLF